MTKLHKILKILKWPSCHLSVIQELAPERRGGYSTKSYTGNPAPRSNPLPFYKPFWKTFYKQIELPNLSSITELLSFSIITTCFYLCSKNWGIRWPTKAIHHFRAQFTNRASQSIKHGCTGFMFTLFSFISSSVPIWCKSKIIFQWPLWNNYDTVFSSKLSDSQVSKRVKEKDIICS